MESRCVAKYIRVTPRKMRLVADIVRGKSVNEAIGLLKFTTRSAAKPTLKAIQSAVANIVNNDEARNVNPDELLVKTIFVDEGPTYRRFLPRAMGRATPIRKRMSHLTVLVGMPEAAVEEAEAPVEEAAPEQVKKSPAKKAVKTAAKKPAKSKKTE
ncbi:MAG: 50S ribosomal protein L22 [Calditrichota bacterium]